MLTKPLQSREDIQVLVDTFYKRVQQDELLGDIFNKVIKDRWPAHLEKMYGFWDTVLFATPDYKGSPFPKHAKLPVNEQHFHRWKELFNTTVDSLFVGEKAEEAKWRAGKMAEMFLHKINYYQAHPDKLVV